MADMGLSGVSNPIFQASQLQAQQEGQRRSGAIQGIINDTVQTKQKQIASQLNMWTKMATESKDPNLRNKAFTKLGELTNTDFSPAMRTPEAIEALKDVRNVINDKTGLYDANTIKEVWNDYISQYGTSDVGEGEMAALEGGVERREQDMLGQVARIPALQEKGLISKEQAQEGRITGLEGGGEAGQKILAEELTPPTLTQLKAEDYAKLPPEDRRKALLKAGIEINLGKPASAAERTAIAETRASIDALDNLKSLFDESFVGPAGGRVGAIKNVFGLNPPQQEAFLAATSAFKNQVIKEITGAQMSEQEAGRIMKQVPSETDAPSVWLSKYEQSINNLKTLNKRRQEVLKQSGLRVPEDTVSDVSTMSDAELDAELERLRSGQ